MRTRNLAFAAVLSVSFLITMSPSFSMAECVQNDLAGTWYTMVEGWNDQYWWTACKLVVTSTGAVKPTTCRDNEGRSITVSGGKMTVQPTCEFTGSLKLIENGGKAFTAYLDVGALDRSKTSGGGGGHDSNKDAFTFRMIKK